MDPVLNSLNKHCKNCIVDSKENNKFDLGVKELNSLCQCLRKYVGTVWKKYILLFEL